MGAVIGRPTKLTADLQVKLVDSLKMGCFLETAASMNSISKKSIYNWLNRGKETAEELENDPEKPLTDDERLYLGFYNAIEKAMAEAEQRSIAIITKAAINGDWKASSWFLERRYPQKWSRKDKLELEGKMENTNRERVIIEQQLQEDPKSAELLKELYRRSAELSTLPKPKVADRAVFEVDI